MAPMALSARQDLALLSALPSCSSGSHGAMVGTPALPGTSCHARFSAMRVDLQIVLCRWRGRRRASWRLPDGAIVIAPALVYKRRYSKQPSEAMPGWFPTNAASRCSTRGATVPGMARAALRHGG